MCLIQLSALIAICSLSTPGLRSHKVSAPMAIAAAQQWLYLSFISVKHMSSPDRWLRCTKEDVASQWSKMPTFR